MRFAIYDYVTWESCSRGELQESSNFLRQYIDARLRSRTPPSRKLTARHPKARLDRFSAETRHRTDRGMSERPLLKASSSSSRTGREPDDGCGAEIRLVNVLAVVRRGDRANPGRAGARSSRRVS